MNKYILTFSNELLFYLLCKKEVGSMKKQSKKRLSLMLTAMMLLSNISYASNGISG
ncbi:hypothetical protein HMPREF1142_0002, partial [Peptostreptococcaceae bacterium AS15]